MYLHGEPKITMITSLTASVQAPSGFGKVSVDGDATDVTRPGECYCQLARGDLRCGSLRRRRTGKKPRSATSRDGTSPAGRNVFRDKLGQQLVVRKKL